jgi:N-acetylmuramoyl-L-alanine amidase/LysM domain
MAGVWVSWLEDAARATGYPVTVVTGWETRGHGPMRAVEGVVGHHTATPAGAPGDYPSLRVVRDGRPDLPGPLANLGLGRSGTIYVIAAGRCYHAGASRFAGFTNLNDTFLGIEAENDGSGGWTPEQLDAYPKLVASLLRRMDRGVDRYVSHRTVAVPAGRKPDPAMISDDWMRERASAFLTGGVPSAHVVAAGDTLWALSRRYGVTVDQLRRWNDLTSDLIVVGQVLRVYPAV